MYKIIYDRCDPYGNEERNISEWFNGNWFELQDHIRVMKTNGCYNIDFIYVLLSIDKDRVGDAE